MAATDGQTALRLDPLTGQLVATKRRRDDELALELRGISKRFGDVVANEDVNFELRRGEVHALLGENGAGKSTLMSIAYGLAHPDGGEIRRCGKTVQIESPSHAIKLGIGMVHQHFMLIPVMTVAENVVLGSEPRRGLGLNRAEAAREVAALAERFGFEIDPDARVEDLTVGEQQRVEIMRALYRKAEVLILDEPTAVLTAQEIDELFVVLRSLKAQGTAIIFISHKLKEILALADRVTVLRRGKRIATRETKGASEHQLAQWMVGREVLFRVDKPLPRVDGETLLRVDKLEVRDDRGLKAVKNVSFELRAGEIVGLAGVDGNGQAELIEALTGLRHAHAGTIELENKDVTGFSVRKKMAAGISYIAEDRHRRGLVLDLSLRDNLALRDYRNRPLSRGGFLARKKIKARARKLLAEYDVRGGRPRTPAKSLSGGNQQKIVIARELEREPRVLIAAQPTRGLDVGATEFVQRKLVEQQEAGRAVLLVSLELDEIRALADRILVMYEGRLVAELPPDTSDNELGIAMTGCDPASGCEPDLAVASDEIKIRSTRPVVQEPMV